METPKLFAIGTIPFAAGHASVATEPKGGPNAIPAFLPQQFQAEL